VLRGKKYLRFYSDRLRMPITAGFEERKIDDNAEKTPAMRALFDTDVILDVLLERAEWYMDGFTLWNLVDEG
jgi:hypothetical protein